MKYLSLLFFVCVTTYAASTSTNVEELKMEKRFGLGLSAGGPLAVMGIEADVNITPEWSISTGLGTGIDYSTFTIKNRFYLPGQWVSPYLGLGVARWWSGGTKEKKLSPSVLANRFLGGQTDFTQGFDVWMLYPAAGVQVMTAMGFAFYVEFEYLFRLVSFANGTYAGLGASWFF